ncbi:MAG: universal stress protein [Candidatus Helarchaeota archaeon]
MKVFNNILVAIDGSEHSNRALEYAIKMAKQNDSKLFALNVIELRTLENYKLLQRDPDELKEELTERSKSILSRVKKQAKENDVKIEILMKEGVPCQQILETSKQINADLIIVAHEGAQRPLTSHHVGSTTKRLIEYIINCPILVIN